MIRDPELKHDIRQAANEYFAQERLPRHQRETLPMICHRLGDLDLGPVCDEIARRRGLKD